MKPPGYKPAPASEHCSNCGSYRTSFPDEPGRSIGNESGYCVMYLTLVRDRFVCDKWNPKKKVQVTR